MIAIIDYEMGNLRSVQKAFERVGHKAVITADPAVLADAEKVVLPGVGAFRDAIAALRDRKFVEPIRAAISGGKPFLGICLGAQMLARQLGAKVAPHPEGRAEIGYYPIRPTSAGRRLCPDWPARVYHWHREGFELPRDTTLLAEGDDFPVQAFQCGNAFGFQFHPDVTYAMMHCWTTRGYDNMASPGARARHQHFADRAVYDFAERAWLKQFIDGWLAQKPHLILAQAAE